MVVKLKVQENNAVNLKVVSSDIAKFKASEGVPIYPSSYTGSYTVTPTQQTQVLQTDHLMMNGNVTVNPIPSNYGLITYNGSVLTVS